MTSRGRGSLTAGCRRRRSARRLSSDGLAAEPDPARSPVKQAAIVVEEYHTSHKGRGLSSLSGIAEEARPRSLEHPNRADVASAAG
jgi:hypothetical protein